MTGDKDSSTPAPEPQRLSSTPIGLARSEQAAVQAKFGVSAQQVRRDHLISHLLGALSRMDDKDGLVFFGGTALSRTLLPDLRLSEDIDLITTSNRSTMASAIMPAFENSLARSHGEIEWMLETTGVPIVNRLHRLLAQLLPGASRKDITARQATLGPPYAPVPEQAT